MKESLIIIWENITKVFETSKLLQQKKLLLGNGYVYKSVKRVQ